MDGPETGPAIPSRLKAWKSQEPEILRHARAIGQAIPRHSWEEDLNKENHSAGKRHPASHLQSLRATVIGNALEWFDWTIYAVFSPFIAKALFGPADPISGLLQTMAIFAVGFVARPIGGLVFGRFADRHGRKTALVLSMTLMAFGSLLIAIIPDYAVIGAGASALLLLARLVQGLAHGGESAAAYVYVSELAPAERRGLWSSTVFISVSLGSIVGILLGVFLTTYMPMDTLNAWGWRLPFLVGAMVGLYALYLRRNAVETEAFKAGQQPMPAPAEDQGNILWVSLRLLIILGASNVVYAVWLSFASTYAISVLGVPAAEAFRATLGAQVLGMIALPFFGALSDRIGRKPIALLTCGGFALLSFWLNGLLGPTAWSLFVAQSIALMLWAALGSIWPAWLAEQIPTGQRGTTVGLITSLGAALFGGTAPFLNTWLKTLDMQWAFTGYVVFLNALSVLLILTMRETRGINLKNIGTETDPGNP